MIPSDQTFDKETDAFHLLPQSEITVPADPIVFNTIPIQRYRKYCDIQEMYFRPIACCEDLSLEYYGTDGYTDVKTIKNPTEIVRIDISRGDMLRILDGDGNPVCGTVFVRNQRPRKIKLGHIVCTYRREHDIQRKMNEFASVPLEDYHLYVIDNGMTLETIETDVLSVIHSKNLGGSGGFTNGMIRALNDGCTHILLNDDDALLSKESVFRMMSFLGLIDDEYCDANLCGIMMDINNPTKVYEAGAQMDRCRLVPLCNGTDVTSDYIALMNESRVDYSNWTCLCIPATVVKGAGLPLPMFIREDDVEYGLRMKKHTIVLPGLFVWHQNYADSYSPVYYYYYVRNRMVALSVSDMLNKEFIDIIFGEMAVEASAYRYECCREMMDGMRDFLKGPDYVFNLCRKGMRRAAVPEMDDPKTLRDKLNLIEHAPSVGFIHRKLTLNGILRKDVGDIETATTDMDSADFYRIGKVLYRVRDMGFIAERSFSSAVSCAFRVTFLKLHTRIVIKHVSNSYRSSLNRYSSEEFWYDVLFRDE